MTVAPGWSWGADCGRLVTMQSLPLPVRVAAGLAATAVEAARKLPTQLAGLPVTVACQALQASMRLQQQVTELAIRGDEVFAQLRPVDDSPPWARFDEDEDATAGPAAVVPGPGAPPSEREAGAAVDAELDEGDVARALAPKARGASKAPDATEAPEAPERPERPEPAGATPSSASAPPALPGYDEMSLPQLRGKLRALSLSQLEALLAHEHAHQDRAPFVTMLSNRIATVRAP